MSAARWRKVNGKWLVAIEGERLPAGWHRVRVTKASGSEVLTIAHSKHCACEGTAHLYFVQRPKASRALSFCGR